MKRAVLIALLLVGQGSRAGQTSPTFTVTGYCHCAKCCGESGQPAANGLNPVAGVTVAGPRRYPLGTKIRIVGLGERVITDRLAVRYDNRIDIFFATHNEAKRFGRKTLTVTILK